MRKGKDPYPEADPDPDPEGQKHADPDPQHWYEDNFVPDYVCMLVN